MAARISLLILVCFGNFICTDGVPTKADLCKYSGSSSMSFQLQTATWITQTGCSCVISMGTDTMGNNSSMTGPDSTSPNTPHGMNIYTESWLYFAPDGSDSSDDTEPCPPQLDVSPSESFTYHFCPLESNATEQRGRMSTFHLTPGGHVTVRLRNPLEHSVNASIIMTASGMFHVSCDMDNDTPKEDDACPCMPGYTTDWPYYSEEFGVKSRIIVGVVASLFFLVILSAMIGFFYYKEKRRKEMSSSTEKKDPAVAHNPAFESPDPMYAEIGGVQRTPDTNRNMFKFSDLPFTPDPNLKLGLDARYSMDSGLYSEPTDVCRVAGHGALEGPSIMRISQTSLSNRSHGSAANSVPNLSRNPVLMTPMTPDEIDALYAKPNKGRYATGTGTGPRSTPVTGPKTGPPMASPDGDSTRHSSNQSLPSFRDPNGSQNAIPPPLATGSRSNSNSNMYGNVGLSLPAGSSTGINRSGEGGSSLSVSMGVEETDV